MLSLDVVLADGEVKVLAEGITVLVEVTLDEVSDVTLLADDNRVILTILLEEEDNGIARPAAFTVF